MVVIVNELDLQTPDNENRWNSDNYTDATALRSLKIARKFLCALNLQFLTSLQDSSIKHLVQISNDTVECASHVSNVSIYHKIRELEC